MTASQSVTGGETTLSNPVTSDAQLIQGCLQGNEASWSALLSKYKNLIFSIPIKYGFSREDAADIFQSVCLDILHDLSSLARLASSGRLADSYYPQQVSSIN